VSFRTADAVQPARREVHHQDALSWMNAHPAPELASVVTSLPDVSEMGGWSFERWRTWFRDTAGRVIDWIPDTGVAMFFQSDIRHQQQWIDKGYLILQACEDQQAFVVFHKIVCRYAPGTIAPGRAAYSHLIGVAKRPRLHPTRPGPDVLADAGYKPAMKSMGVNACRLACRFLLDETPSRVVVDPFCGYGTILAVANAMGLDAIGVDLSRRCCAVARKLEVTLDSHG
jgi:DNA modification methylase